MYNFIRKIKNLKYIIYLLLIIIFVILFIFRTEIFNDQNLYYYTFSTIVQGFLALVAFLGTVVIYKLQIIEMELNKIGEKLIDFLFSMTGTQKYLAFTYIEIINESDQFIQSVNSKGMDEQNINKIRIYSNKLKDLNNEKGEIRNNMVDFTILSFLNISLALIGIPLSKYFVNNQLFFVGYILLILNILISFVTLYYTWKVIRKVMGYTINRTISDKITFSSEVKKEKDKNL